MPNKLNDFRLLAFVCASSTCTRPEEPLPLPLSDGRGRGPPSCEVEVELDCRGGGSAPLAACTPNSASPPSDDGSVSLYSSMITPPARGTDTGAFAFECIPISPAVIARRTRTCSCPPCPPSDEWLVDPREIDASRVGAHDIDIVVGVGSVDDAPELDTVRVGESAGTVFVRLRPLVVPVPEVDVAVPDEDECEDWPVAVVPALDELTSCASRGGDAEAEKASVLTCSPRPRNSSSGAREGGYGCESTLSDGRPSDEVLASSSSSESEGAATASAKTCAAACGTWDALDCESGDERCAVTMIGGGFSLRVRTVPVGVDATGVGVGVWVCVSSEDCFGDSESGLVPVPVLVNAWLASGVEEDAGASLDVRSQRETFSVTALEWLEGVLGSCACVCVWAAAAAAAAAAAGVELGGTRAGAAAR